MSEKHEQVTAVEQEAALAQVDDVEILVLLSQGPTLVEKQVIRLKGCRHPLKALSDESFVSASNFFLQLGNELRKSSV